MNICIHRGAHQIGGTCVELEQDGATLILDLGLPLDAVDERIIASAAMFIRVDVPLRAVGHLWDGVPLDLGPFRVMPHLVDHSAYDSYALSVQSGGKTLFYSGDLRGHGRKAALFEKLVRCAPRGVDVLTTITQ